MKKKLVSVIGGHECDKATAEIAFKIGKIIAEEGAVVVCGGRTGVMEAVCKGARSVSGLTLGILPSSNGGDANEYIDIAILTGIGFARNSIVANTSDLVVALKGSYGTMSEIAFALTFKRKVFSFGNWDIKGVVELDDPEQLREYILNIGKK